MINVEDVELVRSSVSAIDLVTRYGYKVTRSGYIKCPFHSDGNPSCRVYQGDKGYYCFSCHAGGDVIDFVRRHDGLDFEPAVRKIAGMCGVMLSDGQMSLSNKDRQRILAQKQKREAAEKERKANQERLRSISRQLHKLYALQLEFEPLGAVWCSVQRAIEKLEWEWAYLFYEKGDSR